MNKRIHSESYCFNLHLLIETLMQEIKQAVTEKHELEIRDESLLMAIIGVFSNRIFVEGVYKLTFQSQTLVKVESFRLTP